ncbi:ActS/PrrB/RegB family redox-sensitive histidine kinase [Alphaproteobacteria bacterium]|nr:ActS/PrrB/RegB family redox-sensitive histidine kinase [Alphaproteobacteria bacterium]
METFLNNILLLNLIRIRWLAISGQFLAIIIVYFYFDILIPIITCLGIVLISTIINSFSYLTNKKNIYLSNKEAFYFLLFDTIQLTVLLYLTGGIYNPFSLLLIAPLIISVSYLPTVYSISLLTLSVMSAICISYFYFPINWNNDFNVPPLFKYGQTLSLLVSLFFIFIYVYLFANSARRISQALSQTKSALENQKKMSEIGSLSTAAVHELSTPLNTIFIILNDLKEEKDVIENQNLKKEIDLLKSEAERCKKILLTLSKNPENLKDNFFDQITISNLIKINFDKFNNRKILLKINFLTNDVEPLIFFKDELAYALGNIIQNAVKYADSVIKVDICWDIKNFFITIKDDGLGFKNETLDQIGKPYISNNSKGMGLGIFIAKNMIENIGGTIFFNNLKDSGAIVEITVKRVT